MNTTSYKVGALLNYRRQEWSDVEAHASIWSITDASKDADSIVSNGASDSRYDVLTCTLIGHSLRCFGCLSSRVVPSRGELCPHTPSSRRRRCLVSVFVVLYFYEEERRGVEGVSL